MGFDGKRGDAGAPGLPVSVLFFLTCKTLNEVEFKSNTNDNFRDILGQRDNQGWKDPKVIK